jgi:hypothetical protein
VSGQAVFQFNLPLFHVGLHTWGNIQNRSVQAKGEDPVAGGNGSIGNRFGRVDGRITAFGNNTPRAGNGPRAGFHWERKSGFF